jgi:type I site-specific restriction endonuclease
VQGFFTFEDLENRLYLHRNQSPLTQAAINTAITDRPYQLQAVRRVSEAFEQGKRKALLVMATGTGKTRTAMSLVEVFLKTNQARRILFVADREALVEQALKNPTATIQSIAEDVSRLPDFVLQDSQRQASAYLCLSPRLQIATPAELDRVIDDLAGQMKNRRDKPNSFVQLDLLDFVETQGYIILTERGQSIYLEKYRKLVDERVLNLVVDNPIFAAIEQGRSVSDEQLLALERTLRQTLGGQVLYLTETNIRKAYALKVDSLLAFVRHLFGLEGLPDYQDIVRRQFAEYIAQHPFNSDQVRFLRAVETVFLQRRRLDIADLYDPPLTQFGRDTVERWFSEAQIKDLMDFANRLTV